MKTCTRCNTTKDLSQFKKRPPNGLVSWCTLCKNEYDRSQNDRYRPQRLKANKIRREELRDNYRALKESLSCTDCGLSDHRVMEFDHLGDKSWCISTEVINKSWDDTLAEIAKCEPVCANCHKIRTWERSH